jgi:two-component system phosphate regulon response regulator PhoB
MGTAVFLIHHDGDIRTAGRNALAAEGYRVHVYAELDAALANRDSVRPALLILPWHTELGAREAISVLKSRDDGSFTRVILLVPKDQIAVAIRALEFGADDCIAIPFTATELLARSNACLRRPISQPIIERIVAGPLALDKALHSVTINDTPLELAPAEFRLLAFFLDHQERVFSRAELLRSAWERNVDAGPRTVDVHVRRLRKLLEPFGCDAMIQTVRGFGYRFNAPRLTRKAPGPSLGSMRRPAV